MNTNSIVSNKQYKNTDLMTTIVSDLKETQTMVDGPILCPSYSISEFFINLGRVLEVTGFNPNFGIFLSGIKLGRVFS